MDIGEPIKIHTDVPRPEKAPIFVPFTPKREPERVPVRVGAPNREEPIKHYEERLETECPECGRELQEGFIEDQHVWACPKGHGAIIG